MEEQIPDFTSITMPSCHPCSVHVRHGPLQLPGEEAQPFSHELSQKIKWQDKIPDTEIIDRTSMTSIHMVLKTQLRWASHVIRMPEERLPKKLLYGELTGKCSQGGKKKCFKDTLKASIKSFNIDAESWESVVQDRPRWRSSVTRGTAIFE